MRYFVDAEFNGFGGDLVSLAAVPETRGSPHFYEAVGCPRPSLWVRTNLIPVLQTTPRSWGEVAHLFAEFLATDPSPVIVSDCPESVAHAALLLTDRAGGRLLTGRVRFELLPESGFSAQAASETPCNAYRDALALRDWVLRQEAERGPVPATARELVRPVVRRRAAQRRSAARAGAPVGAEKAHPLGVETELLQRAV